MSNPFDQFDSGPSTASSQTAANPFDQFDSASSAAPSQSSTPAEGPGIGGTLIDMARSIPGGLGKGVAGLVGLPGDVGKLEQKGLSWLAGEINPDFGNGVKNGLDWYQKNVSPAPTSEGLNQFISAPTGGYYEPKTFPGQVTERAAEFAPSAIGGPESIAAKALGRVAVPATASVLGGKAAKAVGLPESVGDVGGALIGGLAGSINPKAVLSSLQSGQVVPTVSALRQSARQAYQTVDNSGMVVAQPAVDGLVGTIKTDLANMGFHPKLQPKTAAALGTLEDASSNNQTLQGMDVLRRIAQHAVDPLNKSDTMMSRHIVDHIDDFVDNLNPSQVLGPVDHPALSALSDARDLWSRAAKGEQLNGLIDKARLNSKSMVGNFPTLGFGNALRTEFRKLATNPRGMARFAPDEQTAIQQVATGGPAENVLRLIGKLSPDQTIPMLSELGAAAVDPKMLAVPVAGLIGKAGATALTSRNAKMASELVRGYPRAPTAPAISAPSSQGLASLLANPYIASTLPTHGAGSASDRVSAPHPDGFSFPAYWQQQSGSQ